MGVGLCSLQSFVSVIYGLFFMMPFVGRFQQPRAGSDYVNFYQRLGIPIVDIRYTYNSVS